MNNIDRKCRDERNSTISLISNSSSHERRAILDLSLMNAFVQDGESFDLSNVSRAVIEENVYVKNGQENTSVSVILTYEIFNGAYTFNCDVLYSTAVYVSAFSSHTGREEKRLDSLPFAFVEMLKSYL